MTRWKNKNGLGYWTENQDKDLNTETKGNLGYRSWAISRWLGQKFCKTYFLETEYDTKTVFNNSSDI